MQPQQNISSKSDGQNISTFSPGGSIDNYSGIPLVIISYYSLTIFIVSMFFLVGRGRNQQGIRILNQDDRGHNGITE